VLGLKASATTAWQHKQFFCFVLFCFSFSWIFSLVNFTCYPLSRSPAPNPPPPPKPQSHPSSPCSMRVFLHPPTPASASPPRNITGHHLHWDIKLSQDQEPLLPLMPHKAILCYICSWSHGSLQVYSLVGGSVPGSSRDLVG
jgi:hypothetical protein